MDFSGKQTLIVGGSSGIGMKAAKLLVDGGGAVTLVGRNIEKLDRSRESLGAPDRVGTFQSDLNSNEDVERLIDHIAEDMKNVQYLINSAGVFSPKSFVEHTQEDYDTYMNLNRATFFVTQQVTRNMIANGGGDLLIHDSVDTTNTGEIILSADNDVTFLVDGDVTASGSGNVTVIADDDGNGADAGSGGALFMDDAAGATAIIDGGSGTVS